jgi:hypothetical protein
MSSVNVTSTTQRIVVDPASSTVSVISAGPMGPAGPSGGGNVNSADITDIVKLTQAAYNALSPPNPNVLYYIVG